MILLLKLSHPLSGPNVAVRGRINRRPIFYLIQLLMWPVPRSLFVMLLCLLINHLLGTLYRKGTFNSLALKTLSYEIFISVLPRFR